MPGPYCWRSARMPVASSGSAAAKSDHEGMRSFYRTYVRRAHQNTPYEQLGYGVAMLLSDRDLVSEIKAGDLALEPFEPALMQPSSIDVRLDRFFRVFNNHLYTHIDPAEQQDDL